MYNGQLVTIAVKESDVLTVTSLFDITSEIDDIGLLLKKNNNILGHFSYVVGIEFEEMMKALGYDEDIIYS